ncbi:hypothetical protein JCM8547_000962 [Rhodosporidiobolus lusitaniae]
MSYYRPSQIDEPASGPPTADTFLRLAKTALSSWNHKLAMLAFARAFESLSLSQHVERNRIAREIVTCAEETEWGTVFLARGEKAQLERVGEEMREELLKPWSEELREACRKVADEAFELPTRAVENFDHGLVVRVEGQDLQPPNNFSWIIPFFLAASARPFDYDFASLTSPHLSIRHIISLTESPVSLPSFLPSPPSTTHLPIPDFQPPTLFQLQTFVRLVATQTNEDGPVLVHCGAGIGRTGTMVAAYLVAFGFKRPSKSLDDGRWLPAMSTDEAIEALRVVRSGSVETGAQEQALRQYEDWSRKEGRPF